MVEARVAGAGSVIIVAPTGLRHENHAGKVGVLPNAASHFIAVDTRNPDVDQRDVGPKGVRDIHGGQAVVGELGFMPKSPHQHAETFRLVLVVIHNENPPIQAAYFHGGFPHLDFGIDSWSGPPVADLDMGTKLPLIGRLR